MPPEPGPAKFCCAGRYNDILTADEHYIALDPDLANVGDAITRFRDPHERRRVAEAAYALVKERHTYRDRMAALHQMVCAPCGPRPPVAASYA